MNLAALFAADDPSQSIHPIFPERAELIYGTIASLVVFFLLWKYAWPSLRTMFHNRSARIQKQLDDAAAAKAEAEAEAVDIRVAKGDIGAERARIMASADEQAARLVAEGKVRLEDEVVELETKAVAEITSSRGRAVTELEAEVAEVAAAAIERLVGESLDDASHHDLVEDFIARIGAS